MVYRTDSTTNNSRISLSLYLNGSGIRHMIRCALSALILLLICNLHSFYEQDGPAKVAQIILLVKKPASFLHYPDITDYYRKEVFSAFYLAAALFQRLSSLPPTISVNLLSVLCGSVFFAVTPPFVRRVFGLSEWLTWFALLSTPILVITFCYGNETAPAAASIAAAALCLTFDTSLGMIVGAVLFGIATYSRSDYLLLGPVLALLTIRVKNSEICWRQSLIRFSQFCITAAVFGLAYFACFLRKMPEPSLFYHETNLKLLAAYLLYGPGLVNVFFAFAGCCICVATRRWKFALLLPVLLQASIYFNRLTSPKYIIPLFIVVVIFAVVAMEALMKRSRICCGLLLAFPWLISVTPYGVFGPIKSALWYVPSDAGAIPTGGYLGFYRKVKEGFYQRRCDEEQKQFEEVMPQVESSIHGADLVGYLHLQSLRLWATEHDRWDIPASDVPMWDNWALREEGTREKFMIKTSYLYHSKQPDLLRNGVDSFYKEGRLTASLSNTEPFPDVIQVGLPIMPGTNSDLGRRILFLNAYSGGEQVIRQRAFIREYGGSSWIPRARLEKESASLPTPIYLDGDWACFSEYVKDGVYYSLRFPKVYSFSRL